MTTTPTYTPNTCNAKGMQTFMRPAMGVFCDVYNLPRNRGKHERCSKMRQAVGFADLSLRGYSE